MKTPTKGATKEEWKCWQDSLSDRYFWHEISDTYRRLTLYIPEEAVDWDRYHLLTKKFQKEQEAAYMAAYLAKRNKPKADSLRRLYQKRVNNRDYQVDYL